MKLTINKEILAKFAPLQIGVVVLEELNNKADISTFFANKYLTIEKIIKTKFQNTELAGYPLIRRWREIYKTFGEKSARSSVEALIKRVKNGKGLYNINKYFLKGYINYYFLYNK